MAERCLAMAVVAGSTPVIRSSTVDEGKTDKVQWTNGHY